MQNCNVFGLLYRLISWKKLGARCLTLGLRWDCVSDFPLCHVRDSICWAEKMGQILPKEIDGQVSQSGEAFSACRTLSSSDEDAAFPVTL